MAVALNNSNTMAAGTLSPLDIFMSVTAGGSNVVAFAIVGLDVNAGQSVTSVTYGGQTMTACGTAAIQSTGNNFMQVFYLVNPPTGSNHLVITVSGTVADIYAGFVSFTGVDQTTPVRPGTYKTSAATDVSDGSGNYSMAITSNTSDLTLGAIQVNAVMTTNQTQDGQSLAGTQACGHDHATTAAASVTHTEGSLGVGTTLAMVGFSIQAFTAAARTSQRMMTGIGT